ncbi:MAG: hypothetical protein PHP03_00070 [Candidatus Pacebacteria bacterium]|nr:hypothetical protein [Candidatus Paceibacterota bacterium]
MNKKMLVLLVVVSFIATLVPALHAQEIDLTVKKEPTGYRMVPSMLGMFMAGAGLRMTIQPDAPVQYLCIGAGLCGGGSLIAIKANKPDINAKDKYQESQWEKWAKILSNVVAFAAGAATADSIIANNPFPTDTNDDGNDDDGLPSNYSSDERTNSSLGSLKTIAPFIPLVYIEWQFGKGKTRGNSQTH